MVFGCNRYWVLEMELERDSVVISSRMADSLSFTKNKMVKAIFEVAVRIVAAYFVEIKSVNYYYNIFTIR
jgi:hypothetical protein